MKKLLFMAVLSCLIFSCKDAKDKDEHDESSEEQILQANRDILKAIETGDTTKLSLIADDAVDHMGPEGKEIRGGAEIRRMLADMHNHVDNIKFEVIADAAEGDHVFAWTRTTGTIKTDKYMGMPTGSKLDSKGVDIIKFKNGKATEHWFYIDPKDAMQMQAPANQNMDSANIKRT